MSPVVPDAAAGGRQGFRRRPRTTGSVVGAAHPETAEFSAEPVVGRRSPAVDLPSAGPGSGASDQLSPPWKTQPTVAPLPMLTTPTAGSALPRTKPPA